MVSCMKCQDSMPDTFYFVFYQESLGGTKYMCWNCSKNLLQA
ncbi:MAG: hypothetical protein AABW86_00165 [Candidatus Micrarchaeota archaeon]